MQGSNLTRRGAEATMLLTVAVVGLAACARQTLVTSAPLVAATSLKIVEPTSAPAAEDPKEQGEERSAVRQAAVKSFEQWARANIRFAFSSRPFRSDTCLDRADAEVGCSNPKAARQETKVWDEITSTVANRCDAPITCGIGGNSAETASIAPKATHSFSIRTKPRAADGPSDGATFRCEMTLGDAIKLGGLPPNTPEMIGMTEGPVGVEVRYGGSGTMSYAPFIGTLPTEPQGTSDLVATDNAGRIQ